MRLTDYTDYTLRVLIYCASNPDRLVTIKEIAEAYSISRSHLTKIVHELGKQGLLETIRGRGGGLRLLRPPAAISVGDIVRQSEPDFTLTECFDRRSNECRLTPHCTLRGALKRALEAYFSVLDGVTLDDISSRTTAAGRPVRMIAMAGRK